MTKDIKKYISLCDIYQQVKTLRHHLYNKMQVLSQSFGLWKKVTMDFITGLLPNKYNRNIYDFILIIINRYIKMA